jgi:hypothetical protein
MPAWVVKNVVFKHAYLDTITITDIHVTMGGIGDTAMLVIKVRAGVQNHCWQPLQQQLRMGNEQLHRVLGPNADHTQKRHHTCAAGGG